MQDALDSPVDHLLADKIIHVRVDVLRSNPSNARTHSKKQISAIARSIEKFGFTNPVLIDEQNKILAGHGRVAAAKLLKLPEVPAVLLSHLSEGEKRAYILADNRLAEKAGWDKEILAREFQVLLDDKIEIELTGFSMADVGRVVNLDETAAASGGAPEDRLPLPRSGPVVSQPGTSGSSGATG